MSADIRALGPSEVARIVIEIQKLDNGEFLAQAFGTRTGRTASAVGQTPAQACDIALANFARVSSGLAGRGGSHEISEDEADRYLQHILCGPGLKDHYEW